jgi:sugar phosphate isomerase/epimerase
MRNLFDRRDFFRAAGASAAGLGLMGLSSSRLVAAPLAKGAPNAEKLGWRLGCQAYTFKEFTFYEAIDKNASLGLRWIEVFPGQALSKESPNLRTNESMSAETRKELKQRLADAGVKMVCFGVGGYGRQTFEFAKEMGIETLVSEPPLEAFDEIEKLCEEYKINLAIHNHPKPTRYWDPEIVLKACKGRSKRIGACADTGHWMRSGLNPVECIKKLQGRIVSFHFKDLNKYGEGAHDVPWGTGKGDVKAMLAEIHRQGFKGPFSIEYEHNWLNSLPEIAESVKYFDRVAAVLAAKG